jgi:hypothetical protein
LGKISDFQIGSKVSSSNFKSLVKNLATSRKSLRFANTDLRFFADRFLGWMLNFQPGF